MKAYKAYRQGDVVLVTVPELPSGATKSKKQIRIKGETGNDHILRGKYTTYRCGRNVYVVLETDGLLEHPQHEDLEIPPGTYMVRRARTYRLKSRSRVHIPHISISALSD